MCSIFGYVARKNAPVDLAILRRIINQNITRGPHAFGFAWIDSRDRLHAFKSPGRLTDHLKMLPILRDARMLIGHLRYATHGSADDNINNHPHPVDGGWLVHNGVVTNYDDLILDRALLPTSECDSEALAQLIERSGRNALAERAADAIEQTSGYLAILSLWARPGTLLAARRGNPLHVGASRTGIYLATLPGGLPGTVKQLADNQVVEIGPGWKVRDTAKVRGERYAARLFASTAYRGG